MVSYEGREKKETGLPTLPAHLLSTRLVDWRWSTVVKPK